MGDTMALSGIIMTSERPPTTRKHEDQLDCKRQRRGDHARGVEDEHSQIVTKERPPLIDLPLSHALLAWQVLKGLEPARPTRRSLGRSCAPK